jgi:hypothetical protein
MVALRYKNSLRPIETNSKPVSVSPFLSVMVLDRNDSSSPIKRRLTE